MAFTVRKCLQLDVFRDVKLVAGARGLNRVVQFANIALTADVVGWMKGGEFLITGGSFSQESCSVPADFNPIVGAVIEACRNGKRIGPDRRTVPVSG